MNYEHESTCANSPSTVEELRQLINTCGGGSASVLTIIRALLRWVNERLANYHQTLNDAKNKSCN
jgi:cob(I)alamin adenosyltransferase